MDPALAAAARAMAQDAATRADIEVADVHDHVAIREAVTVFAAVWGRDGQAGSSCAPEALAALGHAGGQLSLGRRRTDGEAVAVTAAFLGRDHGTGALFLHSHATGVLSDAQRRGVGRAMKWHQRAWALERDLSEVRWTFDPLSRRNAVFNLALLGAGVGRYLLDRYGPAPCPGDADQPTDRLEVIWDLTSPRVRGAAEGRVATPDIDALRRAGAAVVLDVGPSGEPVHTPSSLPRRLVRVPADIERLRSADPELARAWAEQLRPALGAAVAAGVRVTGCTRGGWYVLAERTGVRDLSGPR